jgi:Sigma-70 region 2
VLGLCQLILRDPVEAEDAAQQVFLSAHHAILRGSPPRDHAAWMAAIARNECRARIRARVRELRELGGLSYNERALGVSHSAIESLLFRARERVRSFVAGANAAAVPIALRDEVARLVPGSDPGSVSIVGRVGFRNSASVRGFSSSTRSRRRLGFARLSSGDQPRPQRGPADELSAFDVDPADLVFARAWTH